MDRTSALDDLPIQDGFFMNKMLAFMSDANQPNIDRTENDWRLNFRRDRIDSEDLVCLIPSVHSRKNDFPIEIENQINIQNESTSKKRKNSMQSTEELNCFTEFRVF